MDIQRALLSLFLLIVIASCGSSDAIEEALDDAVDDIEDELPDNPFNDDDDSADVSLASNGCSNVMIAKGFAYAACGDEIEVVELDTLERNLLSGVSADDITVDAEAGLLFTQSGNLLTTYDLSNPLAPEVLFTDSTNFSAFSGISAANGVLVVSGGAGSSDTQVYSYTDASESIVLFANGIPEIDNTTGNPDVHLAPAPGGANAFYSQDIGAVANWAIQIAEINSSSGQVLSISDDIVLTPGQFVGNPAFAPANFPVESEFLNDRLYVAHFAAQGIEVIDLADDNALLPVIDLPFEPTNITTDGEMLFVVGLENDSVEVIDPATSSVVESLTASEPLGQPTGVAASATHIAIADQENGLVIIAR